MLRVDRLLHLSSCHVTLRHGGIRSLAEYRSAPPVLLARLHTYREDIRRLVEAGNESVLRCLWPSDPEVSWLVALLATEPTARLLSVTRGPIGGAHTELLSTRYESTDPAGEVAAWRALCGVLA